jgi:hypothetical protein
MRQRQSKILRIAESQAEDGLEAIKAVVGARIVQVAGVAVIGRRDWEGVVNGGIGARVARG